MPGTRAEAVDELLERYLELLDEYTRLRGRLSELQSRVFQHIARANFTAERGLRYGQDLYDERMRCLRRLSLSEVSSGAESHPAFRVVSANETGPAPDAAGDRAAEMQTQATPPTAAVASDEEEGSAEEARRTGPEAEERRNAAERKPKPAQQQPKDPLTWFGLLAPRALRQAQAEAVRVVEEVIPRLATVQAEMAAVEIQVRRARKKRAKAAARAAAASAGVPAPAPQESERADGPRVRVA